MPPIALNVGQFTSSIFTVTNSDGSSNTSLALSASPGNPATLRVRVNPSNNREVGVVALDASSGVNAIVEAALPGGTKQHLQLFVNTAAAVNQEALTPGAWSAPSGTVPAWMQ